MKGRQIGKCRVERADGHRRDSAQRDDAPSADHASLKWYAVKGETPVTIAKKLPIGPHCSKESSD
jgi:hypothetical protein